ncbi:MAG: hypothetical protein HKN78_12650 [Sphingomonadaceae bacterium]|nr:hypothetical protein [Sphingomonadaceae bacterium]
MKILKIIRARDGKLQRGFLLASSAILAVWAMPAQAQESIEIELIGDQAEAETRCTALAEEFSGRWTGDWRTREADEVSECDILMPPPAPPPGWPVRIDGVALDDATTIRYDGGVFQESAAGWTETRDTGETFTYDLIMARPNQIILHDATRNMQANISPATGEISVGSSDGSSARTHQITAMEAATRTYPRPARVDMDGLETADFEGGQLRRSLFGRWIRRDDDGQCATYRLWNVDRGFFSIWDEENDDLLTILLDTMRVTSTSSDPNGTRLDILPLTAVSGERDRDPMSDCNSSPDQLSAPQSPQESGDFPLESFHYRNGLFMRLPSGQWRQSPGRGDSSVRGGELVYDVRESSVDTLILYSEEHGVYAEVILPDRYLGIFSADGVVDQQYQLTTARPDYAWTTLPADFIAADMTTADYDGGQFRMLGSATWADVRDDGSCSFLREWSRDFRSIILLSHIGGERSLPRVEIDIQTLTATVYDGFGYNSSVVETRQLTATGVEPVGDNPTASCRSAQGS